MERTGHFRFIALATGHAPAECHLVPVRALVVSGIPFPPSGKVKNSNLSPINQGASAPIFGYIFHSASYVPGDCFSRLCYDFHP